MKLVLVAIATLVSLISLPIVAEDEHEDGNLAQLVAARYPSDLSAFANLHHLTEKRQQAYVQLEIAHVKYVVAAYSGGDIGAVVLLSRSESSDAYVTDQAIVGEHLQGTDPKVRSIDVDGDNNPEVVVRFRLPRGGQTAIYRVVNHHLELISPTTDHDSPILSSPYIIDLGNGTKDLIEVSTSRDPDDSPIEYSHWALNKGKYVESTPIDFYNIFYRDKDRNTETAYFPISSALIGKPFVMTVINGATNGKECRAAKIGITLNGIKLPSKDDDDSENHSTWSVPVTLQQDNTIAVTLGGNPLGRVAIVIQHK